MRFDAANLAVTWRRWKANFNVYRQAAELSDKAAVTQVAILLHSMGFDAVEIHETFTYGTDEDKTDIEVVLRKFDDYCIPRENSVYERYKFWSRDQKEGESIDQWVTDLRTRASTCNFGDQQELLLRDKMVFGVRDERIKERLLRETDLTLGKALSICRASEVSKAQLQTMSTSGNPETSTEVHVIKRRQADKYKAKESTKLIRDCKYCGRTHEAKKCPAFGKVCSQCQRRNHFAAVCKSKVVRAIDCDVRDVENELFIGSLFIGDIPDKWQADVSFNDTRIRFKLDTGAQVNVLPYQVYSKFASSVPMKPTSCVLTAFGNSKVLPMGTVVLTHTSGDERHAVSFYIVDDIKSAILGHDACERLKLVSRHNIDELKTNEKGKLTKEDLLSEYPAVFNGTGMFAKEYHIETSSEVRPCIQPQRRIPYTRHDKLKQTLDDLKQREIVDDVDRPTDWVSNLVITEKKNGSMRVCLDPKPLNTAIKREHYEMPTVADVQAKLAGKKIFTVLDLKDGFWQVRLSDESSYLTAFNTPWGRMRFLRMPFGICSASEVMQKRNMETFGDIHNVHIIGDDMIIAAVDNEEHDAIIRLVMERAQASHVTFNKSKIQYKVNQVKYMGHIQTPDGFKPDIDKVKAIFEMPRPEDKTSLRRFLGMVKFLSQFIRNESDITAPLRSLLATDVEWAWHPEHDAAIERLKTILTSEPVLRYYDVTKPVKIQSDASQRGLGAALIQERQPVAYSSRAMTSAECNYAQIEKELLSIIYACEKYHQYIYGKVVEVETDHRPLEAILKKPIARASPRIQRMMIRLQRYEINVKYVPGRLMYLADTLSRAYNPKQEETNDLHAEMEVMVHTLVENIPMSAVRREQIQTATAADETMSILRQQIRHGWPEYRRDAPIVIQQYWHQRDELHEAEGIMFLADKIVVPASLRQQMLKVIHESHLGAEKCKARARMCLYWPGMSTDIEEVVSKCQACLRYRPRQQREPLKPHPIPSLPWEKVGMDVMTYNNHDYLVIVDYYSKYPELCKLDSKTASSLVVHCKSVFARHGIPREIISDNMPFNSATFKAFLSEWGVEGTTSSPRYPQSNGESERFVQTLKRMLQKANFDHRDPYIALLEYRNTPVSGMTLSPAEMLMSRTLRTKLPDSKSALRPRVVSATSQLLQRQATYANHYDRGVRTLPPLREGDAVRIRSGATWERAVVSRVENTPRSYTVTNENAQAYRRNRRDLLKTKEKPPLPTPPTAIDEPEAQGRPHHQAVPEAVAPLRRSNRNANRPGWLSDYVG